jgi:hypothetical protein
MGRGLEYTFLQRKHTNSQQVCEKMLILTNHQDMEIKTTMKYFKPVRMTLTKIKDVGQDVEKSELLNTI